MRIFVVLVILATSVIMPARADTAAHMASERALFEKHALAPVEDFPMFELWQWQVVGAQNVVVWTGINKAYLLTVEKPCQRLTWTQSLGLTQEMSMKVTRRFDSVVFEHNACRIVQIRPIDYPALRAERAAAHDDAAR